ncbi:MAG: NAD(P)/FAD-dependent oxidoreductase [Gammaproteobacteria bacterium]|nr:MAG: NAD(P)/FAD-dependent oxidoreductase [Gammaproteobacteria bacterium]
MTKPSHCIIIGAGHNGLTCAAYLAKAGKQVTVLEAAEQVGGAAITREFTPGYRVSAGAHLLYMLDKNVRKELSLESAGLAFSQRDIKTVALAEDGNHLVIAGGSVHGADITQADQVAMQEYQRFMTRFAGIIGRLHNRIPPRIGNKNRSDLLSLAKTALDIRMLGRDDMREFLRIAGVNIYDILQENFEHSLLKGALSLDGVLGTNLGPRSNNSVFTALHRLSGLQGMAMPKGGMGAVSDALAVAARKQGASIRTSATVSRICLQGDRVAGVELHGGEEIAATAVISSADPKTTFLGLLGAHNLEAGFVRRINNIRMHGNAAKLHLALDDLPEFEGLEKSQLGERLLIAPDIEYVERAFNHAKYGEHSSRPVAEITIPSLHDDSLAPAGKHVLSAVVQYAPYEIKESWNTEKTVFTDLVVDLLEQYAPGIRRQIVHQEMLTPVDIEREFRITGGHWHHGELAMDQFLMLRPVPHAAQYLSPVNGLFLCGAGSHPGGGVMGSAGRNAASAVLKATSKELRS